MEYYAHSHPDHPGDPTKWQKLEDHLKNVAADARRFAEFFGTRAGEWAYLVGLWHDLGKCSPDFRNYLVETAAGRPCAKIPHARWGAVLAYAWIYLRLKDQEGWKEIALPVLGHHSGLAEPGEVGTGLHAFLVTEEGKTAIKRMRQFLSCLGPLPVLLPREEDQMGREMAIRMCFSAVVDADYLDTERFMDRAMNRKRPEAATIVDLWRAFATDQRGFNRKNRNTTVVNQVRREVYAACLEASRSGHGLYRLTVPTGGGKTRSGLAFALRHAARNKLSRAIFVLPYTSIIDQTAQEYRKIFKMIEDTGHLAVLEHHSQTALHEDEDQDLQAVGRRLAAENWDAPIIVTTTVQFFESLLSSRPSSVRKLHNIAQSVIVLDEVQALPTEVLIPCLSLVRELIESYGCTVVLCSATQPAFDSSRYLDEFKKMTIKDIVPHAQCREHFLKLRRVAYQIRPAPMTWHDLASEIHDSGFQQTMIVLNTRKDALALHSVLAPKDGLYHLSTLLCGAHRKRIIDDIKTRLPSGQPVCLVSTQVVEAGVDIDFPAVYRACGPMDRIIQAAGRCDREGRLTEMAGYPAGHFVVFEPAEGSTPRGPYAVGTAEAKHFLDHRDPQELHDPMLCRRYFESLYASLAGRLDDLQIQQWRRELNYREVAQRFRLIRSDMVTVIVASYDAGEGDRRLARWLQFPGRETWRRLQPYSINLFKWEADRLEREGWLESVGESVYVWRGQYDERGIVEGLYDPADLIVSGP